jgi:patatin-like phospholipase/acyl hydrolase
VQVGENQKNPEPPRRRILCIDGGGILGMFPASLLAGLEQHLDRPIGSYFDLIAGTSTGGIIAIGLAMGLPASDLLELYEKRGAEIFGDGHCPMIDYLYRKLRAFRWSYRRKHDPGPLRAVLADVLGDKRIGNAKTRLVIPAWNPVARSVYIYKTAHHSRLKNDYKSLAVDAALATAAAPSYFPQHVTQHAVGLLDGGIWANNPVALAVVEAVTLLGWPRNSLHVLSLGCLEETYTVPKWAGIGTLGTKLVRLLMDGQSHGAMGIAKLLTGHEHERTAIYRINHVVSYNTYKMDDTRVIQDLKGLGHSFARDRQPVLNPVFFSGPAEAFEPVYVLNATSSCHRNKEGG